METGEFFFNIDTVVRLWIESLKAAGEVVPETVEHFLVMNEETMAKFEQFSAKIADLDKDLPSNSAIKAFLKKNGYSVHEVTRFGSKFIILPPGYIIDELCDWEMKCRETISSGQELQI